MRPPHVPGIGAALQEHLTAAARWTAAGPPERRRKRKEGSQEERQERPNEQRLPGTAAASARTRLGRLALVEWEETPRPGLLNRGLFPALSLLGYETPEKVDGCHGVMYDPPAVKEVYFWERVHTSSIPSA